MTVLADDPQAGTIDEGRAMAEIIYDEAPGITDMAFSTGTVSAAGKAASITNLVAAGAKVIADDIFYLDEPMFQDGVVAQAVDAAKAAGVNYFASAGNRARQSWEGTMSAGADNDFDLGAPTDTIQTLGTFSGSSPYVSLQWAEPWGTATTNLSLDWYVDGNLVASPDENNVVTGIPNEFEQISFSGSHAVGIGIHRVAGAGTPKLKWIAGGATVNSIEHATNSNAINPDAASAAGSLAVAASQWSTPTTPESFSSRGPSITRYFDKFGVLLGSPVVRAKPALAAADGVSTTVPALLTFFGTSAATPSAAGIATLVRSVNPALTESQVAAIMTDPSNAQACATAAPATDCGSGFIMADLAVLDSGLAQTATPSVTAANPAGPSTSTTTAITGTAESGSTVTLYGNSTCTGSVLGSGTVAAFQGAGITATVPANATTTIFARASKAGQLNSACSVTSASYANDSAPPDTAITTTFPGGVAKSLTVPINVHRDGAGFVVPVRARRRRLRELHQPAVADRRVGSAHRRGQGHGRPGQHRRQPGVGDLHRLRLRDPHCRLAGRRGPGHGRPGQGGQGEEGPEERQEVRQARQDQEGQGEAEEGEGCAEVGSGHSRDSAAGCRPVQFLTRG